MKNVIVLVVGTRLLFVGHQNEIFSNLNSLACQLILEVVPKVIFVWEIPNLYIFISVTNHIETCMQLTALLIIIRTFSH